MAPAYVGQASTDSAVKFILGPLRRWRWREDHRFLLHEVSTERRLDSDSLSVLLVLRREPSKKRLAGEPFGPWYQRHHRRIKVMVDAIELYSLPMRSTDQETVGEYLERKITEPLVSVSEIEEQKSRVTEHDGVIERPVLGCRFCGAPTTWEATECGSCGRTFA